MACAPSATSPCTECELWGGLQLPRGPSVSDVTHVCKWWADSETERRELVESAGELAVLQMDRIGLVKGKRSVFTRVCYLHSALLKIRLEIFNDIS